MLIFRFEIVNLVLNVDLRLSVFSPTGNSIVKNLDADELLMKTIAFRLKYFRA